MLPLPKRHVRFHRYVTVYRLPPENRRSPWMRVAADRHRFERRIRETEKLLRPVLMRKQIELLCDTLEMCKLVDCVTYNLTKMCKRVD